ncbi:MAG: acyltransferase family protein [Candidatus Levyibacteriota bacterium]
MHVFKRYQYIDSLRGIAILLVLVAHSAMFGKTGLPAWFAETAAVDIGPRGVQLFFVVSAFTLSLSFLERKPQEKHYLRNFYLRRFFRIAPLFYLAIIFYILLDFLLQHESFSLGNIATTFLFLNGFSPAWINNIVFGGWSIAVEFSFYVLFPLFFFYLRSIKRSLALLFFFMVTMQFLRLFLLTIPAIQNSPDAQTFTFQFFPSQLPVFLMGITIFRIMHEKITSRSKLEISIFLGLVGFLTIFQTPLSLKIIAGHYLYGLIFALLLLFLSKFPVKFLVNSFTVFMGKISFSVYLWHSGIIYLLSFLGFFDLFPSFPFFNYFTRLFLVLVLSAALGSFTYEHIEKQGIIWGKQIIDNFEDKSTTVSSLLK